MGHLGQFNKIYSDLRSRKVLSNYVSNQEIFVMSCEYRAFKHTSSIPYMQKILVVEFFRYFGTFSFFCVPFLPSSGERDSLEKVKFPEECTCTCTETLCIQKRHTASFVHVTWRIHKVTWQDSSTWRGLMWCDVTWSYVCVRESVWFINPAQPPCDVTVRLWSCRLTWHIHMCDVTWLTLRDMTPLSGCGRIVWYGKFIYVPWRDWLLCDVTKLAGCGRAV